MTAMRRSARCNMFTRTRVVLALVLCILYIDKRERLSEVKMYEGGEWETNLSIYDMNKAVLETQYFTTRKTAGLKKCLRCSFFLQEFSYVHFPIFDSSSPFPFRSVPAQFMTSHELQNKKQRSSSLVSLVLLDCLPQASVLLDADLLGGVELVEAAQVHVLGQQGDHVLVEGLPVRVLEVVPVGEMESQTL
jgi:hypothetical protein